MPTKPPPIPTQEQVLEQMRRCLPELVRGWLKSAVVEAPVMQSAPFLELQLRAQKLGLKPMVRYEIDELATVKFAKAALDMHLDGKDLSKSRPQLLKAALESTRCTFALRDETLIPPLGKVGRMFEAHEADAMRDRNFASFNEAFEWLDRAETTGALAKREQLTACTNRSFLACPA